MLTSEPPVAPTPVEARLEASSDRIATALERLTRLQTVATPRMTPFVDPATVPPSLRTPITLNWQGPAETALRQVAGRIGLRVLIHGMTPVTPVLVRLDAQGTPAVQVLEEIGFQMGDRGTVRLDVDGATVHLVFAPRGGGVF